MQPTPTSAHRVPHVQLPADLRTASHVFVRRSGVTTALSTPYTGPFRVVAREPTHFRVAIPGRGVESVALARIKPAHQAPLDENIPEEEPSVTPPTPPPPGRRPGVRTRIPEATDRATRSSSRPSTSRRSEAPPSVPDPSPSPSSTPLPEDISPEPIDDPLPLHSEEPTPGPSRPNTTDSRSDPVRSNDSNGSVPRFFSNPASRKFSANRGRVNYSSSLRSVLRDHLNM